MYNIVKWEEYLKLLEKYLKISPKQIDDYFEMCPNQDINWSELNDWENRSDMDVLNEILDMENVDDNLYLISEAIFSKKIDGVFEVSCKDMGDFVKMHRELFKERFFNGDTLIISISKKTIWMLHHEGVYAQMTY